MLFLAISSPRPEPPSSMAGKRQAYWRWLQPLQRNGVCKWVYARTGRGAVAVFDVDSNETLHRLLNEWAEIIPATFEIYPLIDPGSAQRFLRGQRKGKALRSTRTPTRKR
jgi:muconolactone delta-isomerase